MGSSDQAWDAAHQAVVMEAIQDWEHRILDNQTIDVTFDFTHAADSYLAEWQGGGSVEVGANLYPWTPGLSQTIHFNLDAIGPTSSVVEFSTGSISANNFDALTAARHEMGHMLGFTQNYYKDDFQGPNQSDKWTRHISGTTFDPAGLNVQMSGELITDPNTGQMVPDLSHVANVTDLMSTQLGVNTRRPIGATDLKMLELAYKYAMIPGDAGRDGKVDFGDLVTLARNYGENGATWDTGDFNNDGNVGFDDLVLLARHYGQTLDTANFDQPTGAQPAAAQLALLPSAFQVEAELAFAQVPEPATTALLALCPAIILRRRRPDAVRS